MAQLEHARRTALKVLGALPPGTELYVDMTGSGNPSLCLGLGILVGYRQAVYLGQGHFRLSDAGRDYFIAGGAEDE